jgi:hypothetical protein
MKWFQNFGRGIRSAGRIIGSVASGIRSVAESPTARTIGSIIGGIGNKALPLVATAFPELAPAYSTAKNVFDGLSSGKTFSDIDRLAHRGQEFGNNDSTVGASLT